MGCEQFELFNHEHVYGSNIQVTRYVGVVTLSIKLVCTAKAIQWRESSGKDAHTLHSCISVNKDHSECTTFAKDTDRKHHNSLIFPESQ